MVIIILIIALALFVGLLSFFSPDIIQFIKKNNIYNGEKKIEAADNKTYTSLFLILGLVFSLSITYYTFELLFGYLVPSRSDEAMELIEQELEEIPVIDLPPPPPPQQIIEPEIIEAEVEKKEEVKIDSARIDDPPPIITVISMPTIAPPAEVTDNKIYSFGEVAKNAQYKGGRGAMLNYMSTHMKYPAYERDNEIEGEVYVTFVVDRDGSITQAKILKPTSSPALNKEALRLLKTLPKWVPAETKGGILVKQRINIPIRFMLD